MSQCSDSIILLTFKQYILNALQYHAHRIFLAGYLYEKQHRGQPFQSIKYHTCHFCYLIISVLPSHLCLAFTPSSSTHISWPKFCKQSSLLQFMFHSLSTSVSFTTSSSNAWWKSTNNESPHYVIFSILLSHLFTYTQIFFSNLCNCLRSIKFLLVLLGK